ncbi:MAG: hypothetical protein R6V01_06530 [Thermoplasmatota archaeon]
MAEDEDIYELQKELEKARTFDFEGFGDIDRSRSTGRIEPGQDSKTYDLEKVTKKVKVRGFELEEPKPPEPDAEERALRKADPTADIKRNREEYRVMCPVCRDTHKCQACHGRGRVKLIFKCKVCMGSGKCQECDKETRVHCPQCDEPISKFSPTCSKCGLLFSCPVCGSQLPAMGTRCMMCHTEFLCDQCGKPYPRHYSWRCPHCSHWNERRP